MVLVTVSFVSGQQTLEFLPDGLLAGDGDLDLLFLDLTALPVMTRSELLTDLSPLHPNPPGGCLEMGAATAGAWYTLPRGMARGVRRYL